MIIKIAKKIYLFISNLVWAIRSLFWNRDKGIILFGAWFGEKFADNSRYLFQFLAENKEQLGLKKVVWVTRNQKVCEELSQMGYEAYMMESEESVFYHKKAGMHIICNSSSSDRGILSDISTIYSYGAKRINLWHGVGVVKGVGCASLEYRNKKARHPMIYCMKESLEKNILYRKFMLGNGGWGDFYFLSTSEAATRQFELFSYIPRNKFIVSAYPRTCECIRMTDREREVVELIKEYKKTVLYLPTFRSGENQFDYTKVSTEVGDILEEENVLWIQKAHSANKISERESKENSICNLEMDFDINVIMPYITVLITDYSSAASDARFFHKPVLFYVPDMEEYMTGDNGVTEEAEELLSGPKFYSMDEFKDGLRFYIKKPNEAKPENYEKVRDKFWGEDRGMKEIWQDIRKTTRY